MKSSSRSLSSRSPKSGLFSCSGLVEKSRRKKSPKAMGRPIGGIAWRMGVRRLSKAGTSDILASYQRWRGWRETWVIRRFWWAVLIDDWADKVVLLGGRLPLPYHWIETRVGRANCQRSVGWRGENASEAGRLHIASQCCQTIMDCGNKGGTCGGQLTCETLKFQPCFANSVPKRFKLLEQPRHVVPSI